MQERYFTLEEIRHAIPTKPSWTTVYRWATRGYRGILLPHKRAGRKILVSKEQLEEFMQACAESREPGLKRESKQELESNADQRDREAAARCAKLGL